jgi:hypothetical protein
MTNAARLSRMNGEKGGEGKLDHPPSVGMSSSHDTDFIRD